MASGMLYGRSAFHEKKFIFWLISGSTTKLKNEINAMSEDQIYQEIMALQQQIAPDEIGVGATNADGDQVFCICRLPNDGIERPMIGCDLCGDWYEVLTQLE